MKTEKTDIILEQYYSIKNQYPDSLLIFSRSDFFQIYGTDAVLAANTLDIDCKKKQDTNIDFLQIPHPISQWYIPKLAKAGLLVVIFEPFEEEQYVMRQKPIEFSQRPIDLFA